MNLKHANWFLSAVAALAAIVFIIGISGCGSGVTRQSQNLNLGGSYWHLTSFKTGIWNLPVIPFTKITLFFKPDATGVYGKASVNLYGADCVLDGGGITLSNMVTTLAGRLFPLGVGKQEYLYIKLLGNSERFSVSESRLVIYCSGGELRYSRDEVYKYP